MSNEELEDAFMREIDLRIYTFNGHKFAFRSIIQADQF